MEVDDDDDDDDDDVGSMGTTTSSLIIIIKTLGPSKYLHLCNYPRSYHTRKSSSLESCWPVLHYNW